MLVSQIDITRLAVNQAGRQAKPGELLLLLLLPRRALPPLPSPHLRAVGRLQQTTGHAGRTRKIVAVVAAAVVVVVKGTATVQLVDYYWCLL